ncbi:MAG TPA: MFS transporter [Candidatus Polarisedimenticolia bacterium]|nr:MFS transporter [Candidatus Polarisedimenticolia bacterium]
MTPPDSHPRRWRILALVACAELLGMSLWFTATAVSPHLAALWDLDAGQTGWLTTSVQLGFVAGTGVAAALSLADAAPVRVYFGLAALLGASANAALLAAPGYRWALVLRFLTGAFLAGIYPPALKMIATWFRSARGLALGTVVGALTAGKATPYLVRALAPESYRVVILTASAGTLLAGAAVAIWYRDGPFSFPRRPFSWSLAGAVLRDRGSRLAIAGYLGHMWELYAMWTWVPAFIAASLAAGGERAASAEAIAFGAIASGGLGCLWGGWQADRIGKERLVVVAMVASGICCLIVGFTFGAATWLTACAVWVWGFFVVADSAQFSAIVTEVAPPHAVGTALTLQTCLGFLLTTLTIQLVPVLVEAWSWRWAFVALALGPAAGCAAIGRLTARRW